MLLRIYYELGEYDALIFTRQFRPPTCGVKMNWVTTESIIQPDLIFCTPPVDPVLVHRQSGSNFTGKYSKGIGIERDYC